MYYVYRYICIYIYIYIIHIHIYIYICIQTYNNKLPRRRLRSRLHLRIPPRSKWDSLTQAFREIPHGRENSTTSSQDYA